MARTFNGSTQYLRYASYGLPTLPITVAAWFRTTTTASIQRVCVWEQAVSGSEIAASLLVNYPSAGDLSNQTYISGANYIPSKSGVSANTWTHGVVVTRATSNSVYLNGVKCATDGSYSTYTPSTASTLTVGREENGVQYLSGDVAMLAIWDGVELTADEIAALAAGYHPRCVRPASLRSCWDLGGFAGQYDNDWVGGYGLTATGSPTWSDGPRIIYPLGPLSVQSASGGGSSSKPWLFARQRRIIGGGIL